MVISTSISIRQIVNMLDILTAPTCLLASRGGRPRRFGGLAAASAAADATAAAAAAAVAPAGAVFTRSVSVVPVPLPPAPPLKLLLLRRWLCATLLRPLAARHLLARLRSR